MKETIRVFENKEYVIRIAEEKSFSKASKSLNVSQPALSAGIKRLEDRLGAPLFDRKTKPITLTEVGREYVRIANEISDKESGFEDYVKKTKGMVSGHIKIGGSILFSSFILADLISEFTAKYPRVNVELVENSSEELFEMLKKGTVDLVIDNMETRDAIFAKFPYAEETVLLAVPTKYQLADEPFLTAADVQERKHLDRHAPTVSLHKFENIPFVFMNDKSDTGKRTRRVMESQKMNPKVLFTVSQQMTAYNMAQSGIGATFVSDTCVLNVPETDALVFYKLDREDMKRLVSFYCRQKMVNDLTVSAFLDMVQK